MFGYQQVITKHLIHIKNIKLKKEKIFARIFVILVRFRAQWSLTI